MLKRLRNRKRNLHVVRVAHDILSVLLAQPFRNHLLLRDHHTSQVHHAQIESRVVHRAARHRRVRVDGLEHGLAGEEVGESRANGRDHRGAADENDGVDVVLGEMRVVQGVQENVLGLVQVRGDCLLELVPGDGKIANSGYDIVLIELNNLIITQFHLLFLGQLGNLRFLILAELIIISQEVPDASLDQVFHRVREVHTTEMNITLRREDGILVIHLQNRSIEGASTDVVNEDRLLVQ